MLDVWTLLYFQDLDQLVFRKMDLGCFQDLDFFVGFGFFFGFFQDLDFNFGFGFQFGFSGSGLERWIWISVWIS